jgi:hypothetical protein
LAVVSAQTALFSEHARGSTPSSATTGAIQDVISSLLCSPSVDEAPVAAISPAKVAQTQSTASSGLPSTAASVPSPFQSASWSFEALKTSTTGAQLSIEQNDAVKVKTVTNVVISPLSSASFHRSCNGKREC